MSPLLDYEACRRAYLILGFALVWVWAKMTAESVDEEGE